MERRRLGGTDLELSVIGLGTWVFGGRWGGADDDASLAACHAAIDAGVNWIDTADIYGQGRAERIVGQALRERRDEVIVATKGGVAWDTDPAFRIWREACGDYLRTACDRSLQALGLDEIDLYQVHWPVERRPARGDDGRAARAARRRQDPGDRRLELRPADLAAAGAVAPARLATSSGYHLMRRDIEAAELPWCAEHGVGVIAYGPLAHGLLTGKMTAATTFAADDWRAESELFADDAFPERIAVVEELERDRRRGRPPRRRRRARRGVGAAPARGHRRRSSAPATPTRPRATPPWPARPLSPDEDAAIDEVLARHPAASRHYGHGEPPDSQDG